MQVLRMLNRLLDRHPEARRRDLAWNTPSIIPVWPQVGDACSLASPFLTCLRDLRPQSAASGRSIKVLSLAASAYVCLTSRSQFCYLLLSCCRISCHQPVLYVDRERQQKLKVSD